jgi:GNAT superfamily N-acetyltransferase
MIYKTAYGEYGVRLMPNQPGVAMCFGFKVYPEHRGMGYGHALKAHQMAMLENLGVKYAICSSKATNLRQHRILIKAGWERESDPFIGPLTKEESQVWSCNIKQPVSIPAIVFFPAGSLGEEVPA